MDNKGKEKVGLIKAVGIGVETAVKNIQEWMKKAPEREKAAHERKLEVLGRREKEMEVENKVMKLQKEREELKPKEGGMTNSWSPQSMDKVFDKLI